MPDRISPHGDTLIIDMVRRFSRDIDRDAGVCQIYEGVQKPILQRML